MHSIETIVTLFTLVTLTALSTAQTVSIYSLPEFSSALPCVRTCIFCTAGWTQCDDLGVFLGCDYYEPYLDSCWCRRDFYSKATKSLYDCVSAACGGQTRDISSAISMYGAYCAGKDTAAVPTVTQVESQVVIQTNAVATETQGFTTTLFTGTVTTSMSSVVTVVVYSTITTMLNDTTIGQLADQWRGSQGLQPGGKAAIAVGVVAGVVIVGALLWITVLQTKNSMLKKQLDSYHGPVQYGGIQRPAAQG
ncbi:hypothetical protein TWF281_000083 [Arthrobotrys megalospora]